MAEPDEDLSGMGSAPRGPSFLPSGVSNQPTGAPSRSSAPQPLGPPRSAWPTVVSILVIVLVAAVVAIASLMAYRSDRSDRSVRPPVATSGPPLATTAPDRIDFVTADGSGQLILRTRSWVSEGEVPPSSGNYLRVEVELVCTEGEVDYDPYLFQAFDQSGHLFEMAAAGTDGRVLAVGTLTATQRVRGIVAFDMPRGEVTLMMSDEWENTVTALQVPD